MTVGITRLHLRLPPADKVRIVRAAERRGIPVSTFVRDAALREADGVLATDEVRPMLSRVESRRFLTALDAPFKPNAKLRKALGR